MSGRFIFAARTLVGAFWLLAFAATGNAQPTYEPVIVVNEKAITAFELRQRALLLEALGAAGDVRALAREQLIDDRVKMAVAERLEIEIGEERILAALDDFATRREITTDQLLGALGERGIAEETVRAFLEVAVTWRDVVQALFRARATPSEQDLDNALDFSSRAVRESVLLQEIAIPFEEIGEDAARDLASRLSRELNRGGSFAAAARRYSRAASAANGGRLDWLPAQALPGEVAGQVLALMPGEVSAPVAIRGGFSVFKLLQIREEPRPVEETARDTVTYSQLIIPLAPGAPRGAEIAAQRQASNIRRQARLCRDLDARAEEFGVGSGRSDPAPLGAVPAATASILNEMDTGDLRLIRDERGIVLLMLCERSGETSPEEREALRLRLFNQRMNAFAQGYLQELRGDAVIVEK